MGGRPGRPAPRRARLAALLNLYLETSALGRVLLREDGSDDAVSLVAVADRVCTARLTYVEAHALVARALRAGRLSRTGGSRAASVLERLWPQLVVVELGEAVAVTAARLTTRHRLRALDAIHLASASALGEDVVLATWDDELRRAAAEAGLTVAPA